MRIKEFIINRYGPLSYDSPVRLGDFTLLWGENEHGKTLTIDALIKLLLGRNVRDFVRIDRVEETPSGYVVIEDNEDKEIKVPDDGSLASIAGLSASECRNIFVIRNSELQIEREDQFYTEITDQLTGLRTTEIEQLQNNLRDLGRLTPGGSLRNTGVEKLKDKVDTARYTCDKIQALIEKVDNEDLGNLERSIVEKEEEIADIAHQLLLFDEARKRERYEKGNDALEKLESAMQKLGPLEIFNNEDLQLWQESETAVSSTSTEKSELTKKLQENETSLQSGIKERQAIERDFQVISEQKRHIDGNVKPALENYKGESEKLATYSSSGKLWNLASIVSTALLAISIIACAIGRVVPLYVVAGILLLTTLIAWFNKFRLQAISTRLAKLLASINLNLAKYELNADSIEGILSNIQKFEDNHTKKSEELQEMKREEAVLEDRIKNIRENDIPQEERKIRDSEDRIEGILDKSGVKTLSEYKTQLLSRESAEKSLNESISILNSHFGKVNDNLSENIAHWQNEISELENYKDRSQEIQYDEGTVTQLREREAELRDELEALKGAMEVFRNELEEIEKDTQWILGVETGSVPCSSTVDLTPTHSKLQDYIDEIKGSRDNALGVMDILEEIANEEQEKVSELFGEESAMTELYRDITGGLYEEVLFSQQEKVRVKRRDGKFIEAKNLSGGAYDQLYFSIRLALGDKILKGNPGFFIIDDPFIKADPNRLGKQMGMLKKISDKGWQIIYFSAKGEVKDTLADDITNGIVNLIEIDNVRV